MFTFITLEMGVGGGSLPLAGDAHAEICANQQEALLRD